MPYNDILYHLSQAKADLFTIKYNINFTPCSIFCIIAVRFILTFQL